MANQVQEIFQDYDPHFRAMSLDEAYMDITNYVDAYMVSKATGASMEEALSTVQAAPRSDFTMDEIAQRQQCAEVIVNEMRARIRERTREFFMFDNYMRQTLRWQPSFTLRLATA